MMVCFAHGKESGPWGTKIKVLAGIAEKMGCQIMSPDFTDSMDPDHRVRKLLQAIGMPAGPLVLVGSSMGGYVVTVASKILRPAGLFLMAPAFYLPGYASRDPQPTGKTVIVHGCDDDVIPPDNAIGFARRHGAELHLLAAGHALMERIEEVGRVFESFLGEVLAEGERP